MPTHPAERFNAPSSIKKGTPLKEVLNEELVSLIAESFSSVWPAFQLRSFTTQAENGLQNLELKERGRHIGRALKTHLPTNTTEAVNILIASLGPPLQKTEKNGLKPFFYSPHSHLIEQYALQNKEAALDACYELTTRYTSEFCIRAIILADPPLVLKRLDSWVHDPNPHVRRLVSEGTRPKLPWAPHLPCFIKHPEHLIPYLNQLKLDDSLYVRRSVANSLGDIAKDHLELVLNLCESWIQIASTLPKDKKNDLLWVIRHALRHPFKKGDPATQALRIKAGYTPKKGVTLNTLHPS